MDWNHRVIGGNKLPTLVLLKKKKTSHQNTNIVIPGCDNHQTAREAVWLAEQQPHERFPLRGNVRRVYVVLEMFLFLFF